jgi:hypothetical protein
MAGVVAVSERQRVRAISWWRAAVLLRSIAVGALAGWLAGFVAAGVGSRLAMRVVSLTTGHDDYGRLTEADAHVGEITTEGTLFLLLFGAFIGIGGGLLYLALRPLLTRFGRWRGLAYGMLLLAAFGFVTLDSDNFDFTRFGSPALNILLFAVLFPAFGMLVAPLVEWLDRALPPVPLHGPFGARRVAGYALLAICAAIGMLGGALGSLVLVGASISKGGALAGVAIAVALAGLVLVQRRPVAGLALLAVAVAGGLLVTTTSVVEILTDGYG